MTRKSSAGSAPVRVLLAGAAIALLLVAVEIGRSWPAPDDLLGRLVFLDSTLPRVVVALLAGAILGLSAALFQRVLRNPIAEPSTLGIAAGAQLAMTAATIYAPVLMETAREPIAFAGGVVSLAAVLLLSLRRGFEPVTVALCGMLVSLVAAALSATLILANGDYMLSLFIWGGGSLEQLGWGAAETLAWHLGLGAVFVAALLRPLKLLGFDDAQARALGLNAPTLRLLVLALAVVLATAVVASVGIIGFVGLAAPHIARLAGMRTLGRLLLASTAVGAILLLITDAVVQATAGAGAEIIPTGAATALLGGPLLLWLLPRLSSFVRYPVQPLEAAPRRIGRPGLALLALSAACGLVAAIALFVGPGPEGWTVATGRLFDALAPWRWPRILAAAAAGAMLAGSGFILQRITANPLASPEVLGVSAGAGLGLAVALLVSPAASFSTLGLAATAGSMLALIAVLVLAAQGGFGPERLLLGGIAVGSLSGALVTALIARGGPESFLLLDWLMGSTQRTAPGDAIAAAALAALVLAPLPLLSRWLLLLPLGAPVATALGLATRRAAGVLVLFAALLSAIATLTVGPLSFVGLMAPHMARLAGFTRPALQFTAAVLIGTALMVAADWGARTFAFPYQMPAGLFAALIGGPYLAFLLGRRARA